MSEPTTEQPKVEQPVEAKPPSEKVECTVCKKMVTKKNIAKHQATAACMATADPAAPKTDGSVMGELAYIRGILELMSTILTEVAEEIFAEDDEEYLE